MKNDRHTQTSNRILASQSVGHTHTRNRKGRQMSTTYFFKDSLLGTHIKVLRANAQHDGSIKFKIEMEQKEKKKLLKSLLCSRDFGGQGKTDAKLTVS